MIKKSKYIQGYFKPINPEKYKGDPTKIEYRSSYEFKLMSYIDRNPNILEWSSEEIIIPYFCPVRKSVHRYFPDIWIKKQNSEGISIDLIEIKPKVQTTLPANRDIKTAKQRRRLITELETFAINDAKWKAAKEYCKQRGWNFNIFTESELGIK